LSARPFVLDASVALSWYLDPATPRLALRVRQHLENGGRAVVPVLWHLEIANACVSATRRGAAGANVAACLNQLQYLLRTSIETNTDIPTISELVDVARALQLTAYDALYIHLAERLGLPLATLDQSLAHAARKFAIVLFA